MPKKRRFSLNQETIGGEIREAVTFSESEIEAIWRRDNRFTVLLKSKNGRGGLRKILLTESEFGRIRAFVSGMESELPREIFSLSKPVIVEKTAIVPVSFNQRPVLVYRIEGVWYYYDDVTFHVPILQAVDNPELQQQLETL